MRVLIAAVAVLAGCYDPSIDNCQFRCGSGNECPDGMKCNGGFCRTNTGSCTAPPTDGNPSGCAAATEDPEGCSARFPLENNSCGVICGASSTGGTERSHSAAASACSDVGWQLGILDTVAKLDALPTLTDVAWVGAARQPTQRFRWLNGDIVIDLLWVGGMEPPITQGQPCAVVTTARRIDNTTNCTGTERYICTFPPR